MKKLILLLSLVLLGSLAFVGANNIDVQNINSLSCNEGSVSIYLDEDNDSDNLYDKDIFLNSNFEYSETTPPSFQAVHIRNDLSKVQYTLPENNMLYSMENGTTVDAFDNYVFNRAAYVFPYNTWVRGIDSYPNKVAFEQPINNINNDTITINYHYVYKLSNGWESNSNYAYWYNQPASSLDHSNSVTYCTLGSTPSPCSSTWSYRERSWFPNTTIKNTCTDFELSWCGDGNLDTTQDSFSFGDADEQCDPADPNQEGWGTLGCSNTCEPINDALVAPTCELNIVTNTINNAFNVEWTINGVFDIPASLDISPTTVNFSHHDVTSNNGTRINIVPTGYGTYTATLTVSNDAGSNSCADTVYIQEPQGSYCGDGNIDWPNDNNVNEECDDGNNVDDDGCDSDCRLSTPSCNLYVNPDVQMLGSPVTFSANTNPRARYLIFNLDDGIVLYTGDIYFDYTYTYGNFGFYDAVLTVENDYDPIYMGVSIERPTNICGVSLDILEPEVNLDIEKTLLTTGQLLPGDDVEYMIELTNNGDAVYNDAYIIDELPSSLELTYHDISGVYPYTSNAWQDIYGNWIVEYSGFDLDPGQTATLFIVAEIREDASANQTLNCAFTYNDVYCELYYLAPDPYILKSQQTSYGGFSTALTTGDINVVPGNYITYRVDFENVGGSDTTGVLLRDHMPLCVDYVSASIHGVSSANFVQYQDINGRWVLEYSDFDLADGQAGYMTVVGQIMEGGICDAVSSYTNDSYIHFYNPLVIRQSSVTANKIDHSVVEITKGSDTNMDMIGDDKLFIVQVENFGPNPISNVVLEDIWPGGTCINYVSWTGVGFTKDLLSLEWTYPGTLMPGDSITLYISGSILDNPACENPDYQNVVNLRYTELGEEYTDQAVYHFAVSATPIANISILKTADTNVVSSGDEITYTITYQNIGNATLNSYVITDYWPAMVDFVTASPFPSSVLNFSTGTVLQWNFYTPLLPGQTGEIILEGIVN